MEVFRILWPFLRNNTTVRVGNGSKTSFWEDKWLGHASLKNLFPELYVLAVHQQMSVADSWTQQGWNIHFRRNFNDWEIETVTEFFRALAEFKGTKNKVDRLWWNKDSKGMYKVNLAYKFLNKGGQQPPNWPWKQIWKTKTPFKVACFTTGKRSSPDTRKSQEEEVLYVLEMLFVWRRG